MIKVVSILLDLIASIFHSLQELVMDIVVSAVPSRRKTGYDADFGEPNQQLGKSGSGFYIGNYCNDLTDSFAHLICLGGSGSKKSSSICFPTLLQSHDVSYVIHDCSGEYRTTAQSLHRLGHPIYFLDYDNVSQSIGFNVLDKSKCKNETDTYRVANVLVKNSLQGSPYDYWAQSAESIIGFFSCVLTRYAAPKFVNLSNVLHTIQVFSHSPETIDKWLLKNGVEDRLLNQYKSIVATPEKTLQCSLSTAATFLSIYNNPSIAAITSTDTLSFNLFTTQKSILYICGSPSMATYCRSISANFFESFFSSLLERLPAPGAIPVRCLIDEASTMSLKSLPQVLALGRKYKISIATLWQDYNQVESIYGKYDAANILANSRLKVFMPSGQPLSTCRMLEDLLGKYQYIDDDGTTVKTRELLTAQEIYQLKKILVLNANNKPMLLDPNPYFENRKLRKLTELPPYQAQNSTPLEPPELIKFDQ